MASPTKDKIPPEKIIIALIEAAIQKLDQGRPDITRELLVDVLTRLNPTR
jgi:hypothetical protein